MNFEYAKITRSRLMGSMGLVIKHSDNESEIFEYYLLDCEGLGFCDYVRLENPTKEEGHVPVFGSDDTFPVPLVYIERMEISQLFV